MKSPVISRLRSCRQCRRCLHRPRKCPIHHDRHCRHHSRVSGRQRQRSRVIFPIMASICFVSTGNSLLTTAVSLHLSNPDSRCMVHADCAHSLSDRISGRVPGGKTPGAAFRSRTDVSTGCADDCACDLWFYTHSPRPCLVRAAVPERFLHGDAVHRRRELVQPLCGSSAIAAPIFRCTC